MVTAQARPELVRHLVDKGLSARRSLAVVRMSASASCYASRPDRNIELLARILALAQRHTRYGVGMIHRKLRQARLLVNHKRVERLYREAKLQLRRRKRKKVLPGERQLLIRPLAANQAWSMDFVFDRTAEGRAIKCLTIVDGATHEAVAIEVERAIFGLGVTRVLDRLTLARGLPQVIRTDSGKDFCGKALVAWAHERGVQLRLIQPDKPNQNAYVESINGRLRDECLNEHGFTHLRHARTVIGTWRREYKEERPKKALSGLTPDAYTKQLHPLPPRRTLNRQATEGGRGRRGNAIAVTGWCCCLRGGRVACGPGFRADSLWHSASKVALCAQPCRDIPLGLKHTPDVHMSVPLDVKDDVGVAVERPTAQARQAQLMPVTRRSARRLPADMTVRLLQRIHQAQRHRRAGLLQVVVECLFHVLLRQLPWHDGFGLHRRRADGRTRRRRLSK